MPKTLSRRTAAAVLAASVGLLGAIDAQAGGSGRADRPTAPEVSVVNQLQDFARILWRGTADALTDLFSAPAGTHRPQHNPPGQRCGNTSNGPDIDPDGRGPGNRP